MCYGAAFAQDVGGAPTVLVQSPEGPPTDLSNYLLGLGPVGALVYGAYLLGRGVKVTIQVEVSDQDRRLLERAVDAVEQIGKRAEKAA